MTAALDPVGAHITELDRMLRGPGAAKRSMIAEVHDGLRDAVTTYRARGLAPEQAAADAVRDFGDVHEIAALMQEELTARQGRRTAQLLVVVFPTMLLAWDVLWKSSNGWSTPPLAAVAVLAGAVDILTVLITAAALVLLLVTFQGRPLPGRITGLTGLVAVLGVLGCGGMSVVMNLLEPRHAGEMLADNPATAVVVVATAGASALVTRSAVRSLRVTRAYRRSDQGADPKVG